MKTLNVIIILFLLVFSSPVTVGQDLKKTVDAIKESLGKLKDCPNYYNSNATLVDEAFTELSIINTNDLRSTNNQTLQNNKTRLSALKASIESLTNTDKCNKPAEFTRLVGNIDNLLKQIGRIGNPSTGKNNTKLKFSLNDFKSFPIDDPDSRDALKAKVRATLEGIGKNTTIAKEFANDITTIVTPYYDQSSKALSQAKLSPKTYSNTSRIDSIKAWLRNRAFVDTLSSVIKDTTVQKQIKEFKEQIGFTEPEPGFTWPNLLVTLLMGLLIGGGTVWFFKPPKPYFEIISKSDISAWPGTSVRVNWKASRGLSIDVEKPADSSHQPSFVSDYSYKSEAAVAEFTPPISGIYTLKVKGKKGFKVERFINITLDGQKQALPAPSEVPTVVVNTEPPKTQIEYISLIPQRDSGKYFFAEAFTTAGPRKDKRDDELGEDITGVLVCEDYALFWVLDGVSNYDVLRTEKGNELFSSRLLAQTIAWRIQAKIAEKTMQKSNSLDEVDLKQLLMRAAEEAREEIENSILRILGPDKNKAIELYQQNPEGYRAATTATLGYLDKQGNLRVIKIGDDKLLMLASGKLVSPKTDRTQSGRFAVKLLSDPNGNISVSSYDVDDQSYIGFSESDISTIIATTDGVSDNLLNMLKARPDADFQSPQVREFLGRMKSGTVDDKALCVVQLKKVNA